MTFSTATGFSSWTYFDDDAFEADYPMSTAYAWFLRNNLAHLADSSGQFRLNFSSKVGQDAIAWAANTTAYWSASFPHTMLTPGKIGGLDIRVGGAMSTAGETLTVSARIVYDDKPVWSAGAEELWTGSGTAVSTTGAWAIDTTTPQQGLETATWGRGRKRYPTQEGGDDSFGEVVMLRLELKLTSNGSTSMYLVSAMVREFPVW